MLRVTLDLAFTPFSFVSKRGFLIADSLLDFEELLDEGGVGEESKSS